MPPLLKIRSERDQMSAIERRIADFILENAHLLRDYSSQQLANALKVSQSSVVKFSQKLGFKGYPDLKYSVGEAVARSNGGGEAAAARATPRDGQGALAEDLWLAKARAEEETRLINPPETLAAIAKALDKAGKVFCIGATEDGVVARAFASRLSLVGVLALQHFDPVLMASALDTAEKDDVLMVFSEHGDQPMLYHLSRQFRERNVRVFSITRHTPNPLRAHADAALLVSAHDERAYVVPLLYQSAQQHLLDMIFVLLCEKGTKRIARLESALERARRLGEP